MRPKTLSENGNNINRSVNIYHIQNINQLNILGRDYTDPGSNSKEDDFRVVERVVDYHRY